MTVLDIRGLSAGYGDLAVVRDLDLEVAAGEVVALLGPERRGQDHHAAHGVRPSRPLAGTIDFLGAPLAGREPHALARDGLAHVPDDRGLFPGLTVAEHLELGSGRRHRAGSHRVRAALVPATRRPARPPRRAAVGR